MRIEKLGKYISEVSVRNKKGSVTDVFSVTNSQGFIKSTDYFSKEVFSKDVSNYKIVGENEFAYNPSRINVGSIDYLKQKNQVAISPLYVVFKCNNELNEEFLKVFLKSPIGFSRIRAKTRGAVRDTLSFGCLCEIKIPILPIEDQLHIVNVLSKAENLIAQRKESLRLLDEFLKSTFLEMFYNNSEIENWDEVKFEELAEKKKASMRSGPFGSSLLHGEFTETGDVKVLGIDNVVTNRFTWKRSRCITNEKFKELKRYQVFPNDVLISIMATLGRTAVVPNDIPLCINSKHLAAITLDKKIANPYFVAYAFHSHPLIVRQMTNNVKGAIMDGLNLTIIRKIKMKLPPVELQNMFGETFEKSEALKTQYQQSLQELENLYGSLSQKAFRGELCLKDDSLLMAAEPKTSYFAPSNIPDNKRGFAKQVLGGKIVSLFKNDKNFTHIKFQKLQYLAEHIAEENLLWNYYRQAAGPHDNRFKYSVIEKLNENKWFE